jgi:hypothetical protein
VPGVVSPASCPAWSIRRGQPSVVPGLVKPGVVSPALLTRIGKPGFGCGVKPASPTRVGNATLRRISAT